jgi:hypothetical protein
MRTRLLILLSVLFLLGVSLGSDAFALNRLSEQQALDIVMARVQKDKLYDRSTSVSCLHFLVEGKSKDYIDVAIREKHGGECPGDQDTSPIVDRFRVHRMTKRVKWYQPAEGEYVPYSAMLKARLEK